MVKFIGWCAIIIFGIVVIGLILNDDDDPSSLEMESETATINPEFTRTNLQYVSSSTTGIVACPASTGIERFIVAAIDESKDDTDRTKVVDANSCSIVGERDVITLLAGKDNDDGTTSLAGKYTYTTGTSAFDIILVDIEQGEHRVPSTRDMENGRYWVVSSVVFERSWKKGEEPPAKVAPIPEPKPKPSDDQPEKVRIATVDSNVIVACGTARDLFNFYAALERDMTKEVERNLAKHFGCAILAPGDTIEIPLLDENQPEEVTIDEEIYSRLLIVYNHGQSSSYLWIKAGMLLFTDMF